MDSTDILDSEEILVNKEQQCLIIQNKSNIESTIQRNIERKQMN